VTDTSVCAKPDLGLSDAAAVELARAAAVQDAVADLGPEGVDAVGEHVGWVTEQGGALTHHFVAGRHGYRGWRWSVTLARVGDDPPTVCEVVLLPGPDALVAPPWLPWHERVRPGDLGVGDLLPTPEGDPRLVPAYLRSDDPAVEELAREIGLGRVAVLSREGRTDAARRWQDGPRGPGADMARAAPDTCDTCGFLLPLAGSLGAAFGVCGNEFAPADGAVVALGYGCGAHSSVVAQPVDSVAVAEVVYDDGVDLDEPGPR